MTLLTPFVSLSVGKLCSQTQEEVIPYQLVSHSHHSQVKSSAYILLNRLHRPTCSEVVSLKRKYIGLHIQNVGHIMKQIYHRHFVFVLFLIFARLVGRRRPLFCRETVQCSGLRRVPNRYLIAARSADTAPANL